MGLALPALGAHIAWPGATPRGMEALTYTVNDTVLKKTKTQEPAGVNCKLR